MLMRVHEEIIDPFPRANDAQHWGPVEFCCSGVSILLCMLLIAMVAMGVLELMGLEAFTSVQRFDGAG